MVGKSGLIGAIAKSPALGTGLICVAGIGIGLIVIGVGKILWDQYIFGDDGEEKKSSKDK